VVQFFFPSHLEVKDIEGTDNDGSSDMIIFLSVIGSCLTLSVLDSISSVLEGILTSSSSPIGIGGDKVEYFDVEATGFYDHSSSYQASYNVS
jgi:hypothetical protein